MMGVQGKRQNVGRRVNASVPLVHNAHLRRTKKGQAYFNASFAQTAFESRNRKDLFKKQRPEGPLIGTVPKNNIQHTVSARQAPPAPFYLRPARPPSLLPLP